MDSTFSYPFLNIRGYQMLPVLVSVGTDSVLESVPNGFFTRGHMDNGYPLPSLATYECLLVLFVILMD
jgi:hypothetical protein